MRLRTLAAAAALLLAAPATAAAATPAQGTVSAGSPTATWSGSVTAGYASYVALVGADAAGAVAAVPCAAPSCDRFALTVEGGPRDLEIRASSPVNQVVSVRVVLPGGAAVYMSGFEEGAETVIRLPNVLDGTLQVDITTSGLTAQAYTASATASAPAGPPPGQGPGTYGGYTYEKVRIPMRDGVELSGEIWRPVTPPGVKVPVILHLTPYHALSPAHGEGALPMADGSELVHKGYAFAYVDVRGTWASGGCWDYGGLKERHDGFDAVEWLAARSWANGRVGMMGVSYPGTTPNAAAIEQPPHLSTIVPISAISRWWGYAYQQGARATYSGESDDIDPPGVTPLDFMFAYGFAPPPDVAALMKPDQTAMRWRLCERVRFALRGYDTQPDYTAFWRERDYLRDASRVQVPALVSHGQLDFNVKTWEGTGWWERLNVPKVLVLGQWAHAYPGFYYGAWQDLLERWMARWLYGVENGVEDEPRVHVQTNDGAWHLQSDWGAAATTQRSFGLGTAPFSFFDDGLLTESEVLRGVGEGMRWARVPVAGTEGPLRFGGRPVLRLRLASSARSTHATAVLCDVGPDGACKVVSRAFMNARYRNGLARGENLVPGVPATLALEFIDKDWVVAPGHRLELRIASSSSTWVASDLRRATNTLDLAASDLVLPLYGEAASLPGASVSPAVAVPGAANASP